MRVSIKGFEKYSVDTDGNVYKNKNNEKRKTYVENGYSIVCLCKNGKKRLLRVHKIVAETFLPNPYDKKYVKHKDGNKLNNCVDNLEWCEYTDIVTYTPRNHTSTKTPRKRTPHKYTKVCICCGKKFNSYGSRALRCGECKVEKPKHKSISEIMKELAEYNEKNNTYLSYGEYIVMTGE